MTTTAATTLETLHPSADDWQDIKESIISVEQQTFADTSYSETELEQEFLHPSAIVVLLRKTPTNEIVGYLNGLTDEDDPKALYLSSVALLSEVRGQGLVGPMTASLEAAAKEHGFIYLTTDAVIANGYADSIQRHYTDRVMESYEHDSKWGRQRYFKIRL